MGTWRTGIGASIGFHDTNTFRLAFGNGANDTPGNNKTILNLTKYVFTFGWSTSYISVYNASNYWSGQIFVDNILVGSIPARTGLGFNLWAGTNDGGFVSQLNADSPAYQFIRSPEPNVRWPYGF